MIFRLPVAVLSVGFLLVAGCSSGSGGNADPCKGIQGCAGIGTVDIDGDGARDALGISVDRHPPPDPSVVSGPVTITVHVATAAGAHDIRVDSPTGMLPKQGMPGDVVVGAFPISRPRGSDLVLHTQAGQGNADQFVVIGWRGGELAMVPRPPTLNANFPDPNVWYMKESHGALEWVTCGQGGSITLNTQSAPEAEGIPIPGGGIRESDRWTFANWTWSPAGSENVADNNFSYNFDPHVDTFKCQNQLQLARR